MPYIRLKGKVLSFETMGEGRQRGVWSDIFPTERVLSIWYGFRD